MLPCESHAMGTCSITGYISQPWYGHGSKSHQLLYINNRCGDFDAASSLINGMHEKLSSCQARRQHSFAECTARRAVSSTKTFPAFLIFIKCSEPLVASTPDSAAGVERDAVLSLLRTAVMSAWRADIPDSFLHSAAAQPDEGARHARIAANRRERLESDLPVQQARFQAETANEKLPSKVQHAGAGEANNFHASAPAGLQGRRPYRPRRQLISSEQRMVWHSAPAFSSIGGASAINKSLTDARQQEHNMKIRGGDTALLQAGEVSEVDVDGINGSSWAEVAGRTLPPPPKQRLIAEQRCTSAQTSAVLTSAASAYPTQLAKCCGARHTGGELLAALIYEGDPLQQAPRLENQPTAQGTMQPQCQPLYGADVVPIAAKQCDVDAVPAVAASRKRGRRGSWPPSPPPKRRAVRRNPAASLQGSGSSPRGFSRQPNVIASRTHALPDAGRTVAATEALKCEQSISMSQALGWRQRKSFRPDGAYTAAQSAGIRDTLKLDIRENDHLLKRSTSCISQPQHCGKPASVPGNMREPQRAAEERTRQSTQSRPLDALLVAWHNPCIGSSADGRGVLQLGDLAPGLAHLTVPQAITWTSFSRARVLQQVRQLMENCSPCGFLIDCSLPAAHPPHEPVSLESDAITQLYAGTWAAL